MSENCSTAFKIPKLSAEERRRREEEDLTLKIQQEIENTMRTRGYFGYNNDAQFSRGGRGRGFRGRGPRFVAPGMFKPKFAFQPRPLNQSLKHALTEEAKEKYKAEYFKCSSRQEQFQLEQTYAKPEYQANGQQFPGKQTNKGNL
jgi:hypothetical protein